MKPSSYKAAIFRGLGSVEVVELSYPACGDDDVIVRNLLTGVCGSDVSAFQHGGDANMIWKDHEFGHEAISEVVEIGKRVSGIHLGDEIPLKTAVLDSHRVRCGHHRYVRSHHAEMVRLSKSNGRRHFGSTTGQCEKLWIAHL